MSDKEDKPRRKKSAQVKPVVNFTLLSDKQISDALKHYDSPRSAKNRRKKPN